MRMLKDILYQKENRKKQLEQGLTEVVRQLKDLGALKIILFGSYITGKVGRWSDLDLLVIMPSSKISKGWRSEIYEKIEKKVECDFIVYTPEELDKELPVSRFLRHILKTGKLLYET